MKAKYVGMCYIMACLLIGCGQMPMQQAHEGQTSAGDIVLQTDALTVTEGEIIERTVSSSVCEGDRNIKCDTNIYFRMEGTVEDYALYHEFLMGNEPAYDTETDEYHTLEDCHYRAWENGMGQYSLGEEIFLHNMLGDETEELVFLLSEEQCDVQMLVFGYENGQLTYNSYYYYPEWRLFLNDGGEIYLWNNGLIERDYEGTNWEVIERDLGCGRYEKRELCGSVQYATFSGAGEGSVLEWWIVEDSEYEDIEETVYSIDCYVPVFWDGLRTYSRGSLMLPFVVTESGEYIGSRGVAEWEAVEMDVFGGAERIREIRWLAGPEEGVIEINRYNFISGSYWTYLLEKESGNSTVETNSEEISENITTSSVPLNDLAGDYLISVNVPEGYVYIPELSDLDCNQSVAFSAGEEMMWISSYVTYDLQFHINGHSTNNQYVEPQNVSLDWNQNVRDYDVEIIELESVAGGRACFVAHETYSYWVQEEKVSEEENFYICVPYVDPYDSTLLDFVNIELGGSASDWTTEQFQELAYEVFGQ